MVFSQNNSQKGHHRKPWFHISNLLKLKCMSSFIFDPPVPTKKNSGQKLSPCTYTVTAVALSTVGYLFGCWSCRSVNRWQDLIDAQKLHWIQSYFTWWGDTCKLQHTPVTCCTSPDAPVTSCVPPDTTLTFCTPPSTLLIVVHPLIPSSPLHP